MLFSIIVFIGFILLTGLNSDSSVLFTYRNYGEMVKYLEDLNTTYPELVRVSIAQETYGLPFPDELVCPEGIGGKIVPCKHYVVHLTNHSTLPDKSRPEVFISGALHGDERVGPIVAVELIAFMAQGATAFSTATDDWDAKTNRWLYELVNTRNIIITPMTNAYGYANNVRTELEVDPNRDYNYMAAPRCMEAMTSRVINEIWRDHIFQLALTFHGGMRALSYEWGSPDHYAKNQPIGNKAPSEKSPDNQAQKSIANALAIYAGPFPDGAYYPTGPMNDIVYGVSGGMEDWAYAASWENSFVTDADKPFAPCEPESFGGYPKEKTIYNNITHRTFNMLVETSRRKQPSAEDLGFRSELYNQDLDFFKESDWDNLNVGHVARNVRLALLMIELVQPYIRWITAEALPSHISNSSKYIKEGTNESKKHARRARNSPETFGQIGDNISEQFNEATEDSQIKNDRVSDASSVGNDFLDDHSNDEMTFQDSNLDQFISNTSSTFPHSSQYKYSSQEIYQMGCGNEYDDSPVELVSCFSTNCTIPISLPAPVLSKDEEEKEIENLPPVRLQLAWELLGSLRIDETYVQIAKTPDFQLSSIIAVTPVLSGVTRRHFTNLKSTKLTEVEEEENAEDDDIPNGPMNFFVACFDFNLARGLSTFYIRAIAMVDQDWTSQETSSENQPSPNVPPQSHIVNARTNPSWHHKWNGHEVLGTRNWFSQVIQVTLQPKSVEDLIVNSGKKNSDGVMDDGSTLQIERNPDDESDINNSSGVTTSTSIPITSPIPSQATDVKSHSATNRINSDAQMSVLYIGYMVVSIGGLVIALTLIYLYKRVFRRGHQHIRYAHMSNQSSRIETEDDDDVSEDVTREFGGDDDASEV